MGRELSNNPCKVTFADEISGSLIPIYYRLPTNAERVKYVAEMTPKPSSEAEQNYNPSEVRSRYGELIIVGFEEGAFEVPADDGGKKPLSSTPTSANYDPAWKDKVKEYASDILSLLAFFVFENALTRLPRGMSDPFAPIWKAFLESDALKETIRSVLKSLGTT